jgi:hypothetical protein
MPPSRPRGGIPGELLRLVTQLVVAGIVGVVGLSFAAFAVSFVFGLLSLVIRGVAGEGVAKGFFEFFPRLFGLLVLVALIRFALSLHGRQWRLVADLYGAAPGDPPRARRFPELVVMNAGGLAFRRYVPLTVGIHARGISLRLSPGFSVGCPPIFLPFEELSIRPSSWYVWGEAWGIRAAKAPDVEIVVSDKLYDWMQAHSPDGTFEAAAAREFAAV